MSAASTTTLDAYLLDDYLVARFRASTADGTVPSRPLKLGLLIDNSGSMEGERLTAVQRTLHAARDLLRDEDRMTVASFNDDGRLLLRDRQLNADGIQELYNAVDGLVANGSTNLSAGMETLFHVAHDYDTVILLTDGHVNRGITETAGLRAIALGGANGRPVNALGYGPEHNRGLLRDLATKSRGSYTYVDSDEILPVAIGDILAGQRTEILKNLSVWPSVEGWEPQELNDGWVGPVVADRDYWVVFRRTPGRTGVVDSVRMRATYEANTMQFADAVRLSEDNENYPIVREQIIRARVARLLSRISETVESRRPVGADDRSALTELQAEIRALPVRPLLLRMLGQLAEADALLNVPVPVPVPMSAYSLTDSIRHSSPVTPPRDNSHLMARLASGCTTLSQQRGVYSQTAEEAAVETEPRPLNVSIFSSPHQITSSARTRVNYTHIPPTDPTA